METSPTINMSVNLSYQTHISNNDTSATLISYSTPWADASLLKFLHHSANAPRMYWDSQSVALSFAGCGIAAKLTAHGPDRFHTIRQATDQLFDNAVLLNQNVPATIGPRLFGGFAFRSNHQPHGMWSAFPNACFILPRYQLTQFEGQSWLTINHTINSDDYPTSLLWVLQQEAKDFQRQVENTASPQHKRQESSMQFDELISADTWHRLVTDTTRRIRQGELEKVVLARARQLHSDQPIDTVEILSQLEQSYPSCYRFLFEPIPGHAFYGATPELLAEVTGSTLNTVALAGSIRRGASPAEDDKLGQQLLANPKERIEHALVVDAIEENMRPLVKALRIAPQPGLRRLSNIQHIQTPIKAELAAGRDALSVVEALHPTPALGGRPRNLALDIITQSEPTPRGWYGAPIGWLDHQGNGTFAVTIRSAVSVGNESMLFAGAGIVADSQPDKEWRETQLKFRPLMDALAGAT